MGELCVRGTPGRGAVGSAGIAGRGAPNLAARSGRGGTTGRAVGWPAKGLDGAPGIAPLRASAGACGRGAAGCGAGGRGPAGVGRTISGGAAGIGARGPDRIWPGRGALLAPGIGLTGSDGARPGAITATGGTGGAGLGAGAVALGAAGDGWPGAAIGGWIGLPVASGGRIGAPPRAARTSPAGAGASVCASSGSMAASGAASSERVFTASAPAFSAGATGSSAARSWSGTSKPNKRRNLIATSSSMELECVFFSATPSSGSRSRISWALTSSSRASSLIRIFFIEKATVAYRFRHNSTAMILRGAFPGIAGAGLRARSWMIVSRGTRVLYRSKLLRFRRFRFRISRLHFRRRRL